MNDRKLVALVSQQPEIYDIYGESYSNKNLKEQAWSRVAKEMGMTVFACKAKWTILRNSYIRYLRQKVKWKNQNRSKKKWHLADEMTFMRDYVKLQTRAELDNMHTTEITSDEFLLAQHHELNTASPAPAPSQASDGGEKRRELTSAEHIIDLLKSRSAAREATILSNPHMNFFNSLIPDVERLSTRRQRKFKERVMLLLNHFLDEEESEVAPLQPFSMDLR